MKLTRNKFLIGGSLFGFIFLGILLGKPILSMIYPNNTYVHAPAAAYVGGNIETYTQSADAIVIGTVQSVTDPYLQDDRSIVIQQDAEIKISQVLKGDSKISTLKISDLADQLDEGYYLEKGISSLKGKYGLLKPDEKVLLFLGIDDAGKYVVYAGPYGKYMIDKEDNVTRIGDIKMSLKDLKGQIEAALYSKHNEPLFGILTM